MSPDLAAYPHSERDQHVIDAAQPEGTLARRAGAALGDVLVAAAAAAAVGAVLAMVELVLIGPDRFAAYVAQQWSSATTPAGRWLDSGIALAAMAPAAMAVIVLVLVLMRRRRRRAGWID